MNPSKEDILAAYQDEIKKYQNEGESFQVITDEGLWNSSFKYFHVVLGKIRGYSICLFRSALAAKTVLVIAVLAVVSEGLQIGHASHEQAAALYSEYRENPALWMERVDSRFSLPESKQFIVYGIPHSPNHHIPEEKDSGLHQSNVVINVSGSAIVGNYFKNIP